MPEKPKIVVILGPTASGKSDLAVRLAKKFNGEIISADSRQVYKGLDIGTGKITKKEMRGIPHHLLDVASPRNTFTAEQFKQRADKAIQDILKRNKLPIITGGTGFYIQAIVDNILYPNVPPNKILRDKLKRLSTKKLFAMLVRLDPDRAKTVDSSNPHRLIRAIEIAKTLGKVPKAVSQPKYTVLQIGIKTDGAKLKQKIYKRLISRLKKGMIKEAETLHKKGLSWERMNELGLEYRYQALYLQGKISKQEMIEKLASEIWRYAKRQRTWFKRDRRIMWFSLKNIVHIDATIKRFLK